MNNIMLQIKLPGWRTIFFTLLLFMPAGAWAESANPVHTGPETSIETPLRTVTIQVASLKTLKQADQELKYLRSRGVDAFVSKEVIPNKGVWYRIYVGRFETMDSAKRFANKIKNQGLIKGFWIKRVDLPVDQATPSPQSLASSVPPPLGVDTETKQPRVPSKAVKTPMPAVPSKEKPVGAPSRTAPPKTVIPRVESSRPQLPSAEMPAGIPPAETQESVPPAEATASAKALPPADKSSIEKLRSTITVQVASLKTQKQAEQELKRLRSHGLDGIVSREVIPDKGVWYRIYIGRFEATEPAIIFAKKIKDKGLIKGFWIKRVDLPVDQASPSPQPSDSTLKPALDVDAMEEKQPSLHETAKAPVPVAPSKEKPVFTPHRADTRQDDDRRVEKIPPQSPTADGPADMLPEKVRKPAESEEKAAKIPLTSDGEEKSQSVQQDQDTHTDDRKSEKLSRFSVGVRSGIYWAPKNREFKIQQSGATDVLSWSFQDRIVYTALVSDYRLNSTWSIESAIEKAFFSDLDLWHFSVGPKIEFMQNRMLTPYARAGLVLGRLAWAQAPGEFEMAVGWEGGLGISYKRSNIQIGIETSFRKIEFDYNRPSEAGVTASDGQIDFSSYGVSGIVSYWF